MQQVLELLQAKPGQKAKDIATHLGVDRSTINSLLYGPLQHDVTQDKSYRWWPKDAPEVKKRQRESPQKLDTPLARLCRYYLDCLNHDDQGGLGVFASSQFDLDYVELQTLPLVAEAPDEIFGDEAVRKLSNKTKRDRSRLTLVLGYPVRLAKVRGRRGWEGFMVEPVLLFPYHDDPANRYATPTLSDELPQINSKAIRSLAAADGASIVEEIVQLAGELGLANIENELPDLDEIIPRLRAVRPEWDWKEQPDPYNLVQSPRLSDTKEPGIYNRAVLLAAERSPYTKGLETELAMLQAVPESKYRNTALAAWVSGKNNVQVQSVEPTALLEVLPPNSEQRQWAVQCSICRRYRGCQPIPCPGQSDS